MFEWQLTRRLRTAITLAALALLIVLGVTWGWAQVLKPFPGKVDAPICVDTSYQAGEELSVQDITVSVLNASGREGLAGRTLQELVGAGFSAGQIGNAPKGTSLTTPAEIWVPRAGNPAAQLLRKQVGPVPVVEHPENREAGITLVVGRQFGELGKGPSTMTLTEAAVVCSPPVE